MGYPMEDENVKSIINDLIHHLEKEKLNEIEKNIIFILFDENESGMVRTSMSFPPGNKRRVISGIRTNNFEKKYLQKFPKLANGPYYDNKEITHVC